MEKKADELSERFLNFGVEIILVINKLNGNQINRHLALQLFRSATSVGANYEEARGAESRQDFSHKMQIALKEARESLYWLKLVKRTKLLKENDLDMLISENQQICDIIAKSIFTLKNNLKT
jgi:four helix bundle protein